MSSRTRLALLLGLSLALLLSACSLQINTTLEADQSGLYALEVGFTPEEQEGLEALDTNVEDFCAEVAKGEEAPPGATTKVEERGEDMWCILTVPFKNLKELREIYEEMEGLEVNALEVKDGELIYDLTLVAETQELEADELELAWQVTLPGAVGRHNATEADGNTLRWDLTAGETVQIQARSQLGGMALPGMSMDNPLMLVGGAVGLLACCVVMIALGVGAFVLLRRRGAAPTG